jgi:hypothetical protein
MARNITLKLGSGAGVDLGPNFNITVSFGTITPTTATRAEMLTGKTFSISSDNAVTVTTTSTGTCTNSTTTNIAAFTPPVFSTFYLSAGVLDNDGHCGQNYLTGTPVYVAGTITTVPPLLNQTLYSDTLLTTEFNGGNLYYFVDINSGASTTDFLTNFAQYPVISIASNGYVGTYETVACSGGGGGGGTTGGGTA